MLGWRPDMLQRLYGHEEHALRKELYALRRIPIQLPMMIENRKPLCCTMLSFDSLVVKQKRTQLTTELVPAVTIVRAFGQAQANISPEFCAAASQTNSARSESYIPIRNE